MIPVKKVRVGGTDTCLLPAREPRYTTSRCSTRYWGQYYSTRRVAGTIPAPRRPGKFPASCRGARAPPYNSSDHFPRQVALAHALPSFLWLTTCAWQPLTHPHARNNHRRSRVPRDRRRFLSFLDLLLAPAPLQQQQHMSASSVKRPCTRSIFFLLVFRQGLLKIWRPCQHVFSRISVPAPVYRKPYIKRNCALCYIKRTCPHSGRMRPPLACACRGRG
eukprot:SAG11_NODE_1160_length_5647_cov_8.048125_1_plen_219_part_00